MSKKLHTRMKGLLTVSVLLMSACQNTNSSDSSSDNSFTLEDEAAMKLEMEKSFDFFWKEVQDEPTSPAYGLIADRARGSDASIASVGFGLAAIPIGVEYGWISEAEGRQRALGTLTTLENIETINGFYHHFLDMETGLRSGNSEVSVIDTAIMAIGGLIAGEYFGSEIASKATSIYENINWRWYTGINPNGNKSQFRMGYDPDTEAFAGYWDFYAEQLMLYVLGAGSSNPDFQTNKSYYDGFTKSIGAYDGDNFIYSWFGSLFTYQFSHAFIDFSAYSDADGVDWYQNSVDATIASYDYCVDNKDRIATFSEDSWGLTACDTKFGYNGFLGTPPRGWSPSSNPSYAQIEGTVAPAAALGSMPFTPELSLKALYHYQNDPELNGIYGLYDSYDLVNNWYGYTYIGIDKGVTILMLANALDGFIWKLASTNTILSTGLERIGFVKQ